MKYRKKDNVIQSGYISYLIQYKLFIFWFNYQYFATRNSRDFYLNKLQNETN